jgi:hypothetical protein
MKFKKYFRNQPVVAIQRELIVKYEEKIKMLVDEVWKE